VLNYGGVVWLLLGCGGNAISINITGVGGGVKVGNDVVDGDFEEVTKDE
jgi:hypothetical protein